MSRAVQAEKKQKGDTVPVQVQIDRELIRLARIHCVNTQNRVSRLVNRLLREYLDPSDGPKPAA
jgi:hypothetical protein